MRIAVVGSGVSGLVSAYLLNRQHDVTLFESEPRLGGHAHTVHVELDHREVAVDIGFLVYNEKNYPILTRLFDQLGVATKPSDMSFAVNDPKTGLEWAGSLKGLLAQPGNLLKRDFRDMLRDVRRFNREASAFLENGSDLTVSLGEWLTARHYGEAFLKWYLVPMGASIWSADPTTFLKFPALSFMRFFNNHGLLSVSDHPKWRTVVGGSRHYVDAIARHLSDVRPSTSVTSIERGDGVVMVATSMARHDFDHVVIATHSNQALDLLQNPTISEREILGSIGYRPNHAVLHTDASSVARRRWAQASWNWRNYEGSLAPTLTYDITRLQSLSTSKPIYLTLNDEGHIDPRTVLLETSFTHPVFDVAAMQAQQRHAEVSGVQGISYVGAYWGFGFHEDGARSALTVARSLGVLATEFPA